MTAPGLGIAYSLWLRIRWPAGAILLYLICLAVAAQFLTGSGEPVLLAALLLIAAVTHLLQAFSLGPADLGIRASGYPKHMFVLPLATRSLVGWPMLIGAATHAGLWVLVAVIVFKPAGFAAPVLWPAALIAAGTAWVQAIGWSPSPTPFARVPALALAITPLVFLGMWAGLFMERSTVSSTVVAGGLAWAMLAYLFAVRGVSQARRGNEGNWNFIAERLRAVIAGQRPVTVHSARAAFRSPAGAQLWHEWRRNACFLPAMIGLIGLPMLALGCQAIIIPGSHRNLMFGSLTVTPALMILLAWIGILLMLATTLGASFGKFDLWGKEAILSFFAIRPMTTAQFVLVKLAAAALSALGSIAILFVLMAVWAIVDLSPLNQQESLVRSAFGELTWRSVAISAAAVFGLFVLTWRSIATGMWPSLAGRKWISVVIAMVFMGVLTIGVIAGSWIYRHPEIQAECLRALPWVLGALVVVKVGIAAWTVRALQKNGHTIPRTMALLLGGWIAIFISLLAGVNYFSPVSFLMSAGVALFIPFTRLALAPLALHWNRHR